MGKATRTESWESQLKIYPSVNTLSILSTEKIRGRSIDVGRRRRGAKTVQLEDSRSDRSSGVEGDSTETTGENHQLGEVR